MESLPDEILCKILENPCLHLRDVVRFFVTSRRFQSLKYDNILWKKKFNQSIKNIKINSNPKLWYYEIKEYFELQHQCMDLLESMAKTFYHYKNLSDRDFVRWHPIIYQSDNSYSYIIHILSKIVNRPCMINSITTVPLTMYGNKTMKYYAFKVLRYMRKIMLTPEVLSYLKLPPEKMLLEKGATLIAQWCQPELIIEWEVDVAPQLDNIAERVKSFLKESHSDHSIFKKTEEELTKWKSEILTDNQYDKEECRQLVAAIIHVLVNEYHLPKHTVTDFGYFSATNSFIDKVLKTGEGLPITLSIIYESVARRLGILFEPANVPNHFLLRYLEGRSPHSSVKYIDAFNFGEILDLRESQYIYSYPSYKCTKQEKILERICYNLANSLKFYINGPFSFTHIHLYELLLLITPCHLEIVQQLFTWYMLDKMDIGPIRRHILKYNKPSHHQLSRAAASPAGRILAFMDKYEENQTKPKYEISTWSLVFGEEVSVVKRPNKMKYAVGMVMHHIPHNKECVIIEWHIGNDREGEWKTLRRTVHDDDVQIYYTVLIEDGRREYPVSEENIEPTNNVEVILKLEEIGKHFSHFFGPVLIPNEQKRLQYPEDCSVRNRYYFQQALNSKQT